MDKCREAFEKQKHLTIYISNLVFDEKDNRYITNEKRIRTFEEWEWKAFSNQAYAVNLAWWAWQPRQAEIEEKDKKIKAVEQILIELKESMTNFKEMDLYDKGVRVVTDCIIRDLEKAMRGEHE